MVSRRLIAPCLVLFLAGLNISPAETSEPSEPFELLVLTGGEADVWRFQLTPGWGEHLIYGPGHLYAARTYFYKGLLRYRERFERYLGEDADWKVEVVNLDDSPPPSDFGSYKAVVLDDVRGEALEPAMAGLKRYVADGGALFVAAGAHGLGGHELQKRELPSLPIDLLFDPPAEGSPYEPIAWSHFSTTSSYRDTPLEAVLPVSIISQPDLVVYDRLPHGGGRWLDVQRQAPESFLDALPLQDLQIVGYHKVQAKPEAQVLATVGPDKDPLVVSGRFGEGTVTVFTGNELEGAVRRNGQPSNASINAPVLGEEVLLWPFTDIFWEAAVRTATGTGAAAQAALPESIAVGESLTVRIEAAGQVGAGQASVRRIGDDRSFYARTVKMDTVGERFRLALDALPEGEYHLSWSGEVEGAPQHIAAGLFRIEARGVSLKAPEKFAIREGTSESFIFTVESSETDSAEALEVAVLRSSGETISRKKLPVAYDEAGVREISATLHGKLSPGRYRLQATVTGGGKPLARVEQPLRIRGAFETPELFMMIAGTNPSFPVMEDLADNNAVMTLQYHSIEKFVPYAEYFGGIPRAPHLTDGLDLDEAHRWENWKGEKISGGNGGRYSWALPEVLEKRDENLIDFAQSIEDTLLAPIVLFDDEPMMPMDGGWEAAEQFEAESGFEAPEPKPLYEDADYMERWTAWEDFRSANWANFYRRGTEALKSVDPDLRTTVVVEGMGKDVYAGFDPSISQAPLDIYWFHIYPINEPLTMIGHAVERGKSALRVIGDPYRERFALLQNWAAVGETPQVPPADYIENQYWMAIAHGATGIGYWPYAYGWWTSPGTPGWEEMGRISERQDWLAPALRNLTDERDPIALLYSSSQAGLDHLKGLLAETAQESARPWRNYHVTDEAYHSLKQSGLPFEILDERELMAEGAGLPYEAIVLGGVEFLRKESRAALEAFQRAGGDVWLDESSTFDFPRAKRMPTRFDDIYKLIFPEDPERFNYFKHRDDFQPLIDANREIVREYLDGYDDGRVRVSNDTMVWNELDGGEATYLFFVNNTAHTENLAEFRDISRDWRLTPVEWDSAEAEVSVAGQPVILDLETERLLDVQYDKGRSSWELALEPGAGVVYALLDRRPDAFKATVPDSVAKGERLQWSLRLIAGETLVEAVLPVTVRLETEAGTRTLRTASKGGEVAGSFVLGAEVPAGGATLHFEQKALGLSASVEFEIEPEDLAVITP